MKDEQKSTSQNVSKAVSKTVTSRSLSSWSHFYKKLSTKNLDSERLNNDVNTIAGKAEIEKSSAVQFDYRVKQYIERDVDDKNKKMGRSNNGMRKLQEKGGHVYVTLFSKRRLRRDVR